MKCEAKHKCERAKFNWVRWCWHIARRSNQNQPKTI